MYKTFGVQVGYRMSDILMLKFYVALVIQSSKNEVLISKNEVLIIQYRRPLSTLEAYQTQL